MAKENTQVFQTWSTTSNPKSEDQKGLVTKQFNHYAAERLSTVAVSVR